MVNVADTSSLLSTVQSAITSNTNDGSGISVSSNNLQLTIGKLEVYYLKSLINLI